MGHDPQPRVGQASNQAIKVDDRFDVAGRGARTDPGKGTPEEGQAVQESRAPRQTTSNPVAASPRPATPNTYRRFTWSDGVFSESEVPR